MLVPLIHDSLINTGLRIGLLGLPGPVAAVQLERSQEAPERQPRDHELGHGSHRGQLTLRLREAHLQQDKGDAAVLKARLNGDGRDLRQREPEGPGQGRAKEVAAQRYGKTGRHHQRRDELKDEQVDVDAGGKDEDDGEEGEGDDDPLHDGPGLGPLPADPHAQGDGQDEPDQGGDQLPKGNDQVAFGEVGTDKENPGRHHAQGGHRAHKGHRDGEVHVALQQQSPEVGTVAAGGTAQHEQSQPEQLVFGEEVANEKGDCRHKEELGHKADHRAHRPPEDLAYDVEVQLGAHVHRVDDDHEGHDVEEGVVEGAVGDDGGHGDGVEEGGVVLQPELQVVHADDGASQVEQLNT